MNTNRAEGTKKSDDTLSASGPICSTGSTVHVLREHLDVLDRRRRQDAVSEVEDVSRTPADERKNVVGLREHPVGRPEQERGVEISLDGAVMANAVPRDIHRDTTVHPNHVTTRFPQLVEN